MGPIRTGNEKTTFPLYPRSPVTAKLSFVPAPRTLDAPDLHAAIERIATAIEARHGAPPPLYLAGVSNGGLELAARLAARLGVPAAQLNPAFHRDDIGRNPIPKETQPSRIPFDVTGTTVVIVDDVLHSGRTLKAALDELFDWGRPAAVELAVLIDRGGRRLPFAADYCGLTVDTRATEKVEVTLNPDDPAQDRVTITAKS